MSNIVPSPASPEFDRKLEAERARWLRRRFLWFCGVIGVINILAAPFVLLPGIVERLAGARVPGRGYPTWIDRAELVVVFALVMSAFLYVLVRPPPRRKMLMLAEVVTAGGGALNLMAELGNYHLLGVFEVYAWVGTASWMILANHLPACLFLPWTSRECLRPGAFLLAVNAVVLATHLPRGTEAAFAVGAIALSPLLLTPGLFICWSRQGRFRSNFKLLFESEAYRRMQGEMASARRIHELCLPAPLLDGAVCLQYAYAPMQQIGGDLLFVPPGCVKANDGRVSFVVLDVTGHGVAAALTVNRLVGELERVFGESADASPRDVLCALNRYVHLTLARHGIFVSALCVHADANRGVVQWASGGHPTAFLCRADGRFENLESTGTLLGAEDGSDYCPEQLELPFQPGDAVIAYTDGATEARDASGAAIRTDGLLRMIASICGDGRPPAEWPGAVLRRVASHTSDDRDDDDSPEDDILVAALYRPGGGQRAAGDGTADRAWTEALAAAGAATAGGDSFSGSRIFGAAGGGGGST